VNDKSDEAHRELLFAVWWKLKSRDRLKPRAIAVDAPGPTARQRLQPPKSRRRCGSRQGRAGPLIIKDWPLSLRQSRYAPLCLAFTSNDAETVLRHVTGLLTLKVFPAELGGSCTTIAK
jgi:hypothetical protein